MALTTTALLRFRWLAVARHGAMGPTLSFEPWTDWIPPDLHGFSEWVMDAFSLPRAFVQKVVHGRKATRLQAWLNWIWEELGL